MVPQLFLLQALVRYYLYMLKLGLKSLSNLQDWGQWNSLEHTSPYDLIAKYSAPPEQTGNILSDTPFIMITIINTYTRHNGDCKTTENEANKKLRHFSCYTNPGKQKLNLADQILMLTNLRIHKGVRHVPLRQKVNVPRRIQVSVFVPKSGLNL